MKRLGFLFVMLLAFPAVMVFDVKHVSASSPPPDSVRYCDSVYYVKGRSYSGTHEDTHTNNSAYHVSKGDRTSEVPQRVLFDGGGGFILNVRYGFTTGGLIKNQISKIEVEAYAHTDGSSEEYGVWLDIYNYRTATWDNVGFFYGNTSDQTIMWTDATVAADHSPADYVDSAGNMELKWFFWTSDFSKLYINFECIKLTLRPWTFMVYMASDNNLYFWINYTVNMMEDAGSTSNVAVLVQLDWYDSPYNVTRYLILKDNDTDHITSPSWSLGEENMGDPSTLVDFVNWSIQAYPSKHYALILWDHGWGFRGVCYDDNPTDNLDMTELRQALNDTGVTFDLIGFDACYMGQLEVAHQIEGFAQVMLGYENYGDQTFLPYDTTLMNLTDNPMMSGAELARNFVINYKEYHLTNHRDDYSETISAVSLANVTELSSRVSDLAAELQENLEEYRDGINCSRSQVQEYWLGTDVPDYVDVYHLAELLEQNINNTTVTSLCQQVKQALNATIISEWHFPDGGRPNSHGLSIYFPDVQGDYEAQYDYTEFSSCTQWDEFLKAYLGI